MSEPEVGQGGARPQLRLPTFRESLVISGVVALIGFLFIHHYNPVTGPISNIMNSAIYLTEPCSAMFIDGCDAQLPYRWILACLILFIAFCWFWEKRSKP